MATHSVATRIKEEHYDWLMNKVTEHHVTMAEVLASLIEARYKKEMNNKTKLLQVVTSRDDIDDVLDEIMS